MEQKLAIYKDIICLETQTPNGGKWWYQAGNLTFSPLPVSAIRGVHTGVVTGTRRRIVAVRISYKGSEHLVAINLARSDIPALVRRGQWPDDLKIPIPNPTYSDYPDAPIDLV